MIFQAENSVDLPGERKYITKKGGFDSISSLKTKKCTDSIEFIQNI